MKLQQSQLMQRWHIRVSPRIMSPCSLWRLLPEHMQKITKRMPTWVTHGHELLRASHEMQPQEYLDTRATSPGQLRHPGETEHVDRLQRRYVLQLKWSASAFKPIHVQPGSIPVHMKGFWTQNSRWLFGFKKAPNNTHTHAQKKKKINLGGRKCWMSHFVRRQFNFLVVPFALKWWQKVTSHFCTLLLEPVTPFRCSPPDSVEPR